MSQIVTVLLDSKTFVFPGTIKDVMETVFTYGASLKSLVLNEGLETLGGRCSIFVNSTHLKRVVLPASLRVLGDSAFQDTKRLRHVTFREGSRLEKIGKYCFAGSGIEEFRAPPSLREIGAGAFELCENLKLVSLNEGLETIGKDGARSFSNSSCSCYKNGRGHDWPCKCVFLQNAFEEITLPSTLVEIINGGLTSCRNLKVVWVEDGCQINPRVYVDDNVMVLPANTMVGSALLRNLR